MIYCTKEQAIALKQHGYHEPCIAFYDEQSDKAQGDELVGEVNWNMEEGTVSCPTIYDAVDWLDEKLIFVKAHPEEWNHWYADVLVGYGCSFVHSDRSANHPSRIAAMSAGLDIALDYYQKTQKEKNGSDV